MTGGDGRRTAAAVAARRHNTQAALARVRDVLARMRREKTPVTVAAVSRRAAVSRTFLYSNPEAQALLAYATADTRARTAQDLTGHDAGQEATWRDGHSTPRAHSRPRTPRSSSSGNASASSSARFATWKPSGPRKPSSASPPKTPPSNSEYAS
jgi:hypothetical protein